MYETLATKKYLNELRTLYPALERYSEELQRRGLNLVSLSTTPKQEPTFRGAALQIQTETVPELAIEGPAGTGKSFAALYKLHHLCETEKNLRILIVRQTRESLTESALVTLEKSVMGDDSPLTFGPQRSTRHSYRYSETGSEIIVAGLKQSGKDQRAKVMSTEYDIIYVQEANEILEEDYEKLTTRLRNGKLSYQQIILDFNPDSPLHWLYRRETAGKLKILFSLHKDNPRLWDGTDWTDEGRVYLNSLAGLTGVLRLRLYEGKRALATGLVYSDVWSDGPTDGNVTEQAEFIPGGGPVVWFVDDGYAGELDSSTGEYTATSHPRVFLFAQERNDGRIAVFAESYACKKLADVHLQEILEQGALTPEWAAVDKSAAELRGRLYKKSIYIRSGPPSVEESIKVTRDWLAPDMNGVRKVIVHPRCKHLRAEMAAYRRDEDGRIIKAFDHGPDGLRYGCWAMRHNQ